MNLFACRGCEARDREILHLLALLEEGRKQLDKVLSVQAEIVAPGASARAIPKPVTAAARAAALAPPRPPRVRAPNFPGYERGQPEGPDVEIS